MFGILMDPIYEEHDTGGHPENPRRLRAIKTAMNAVADDSVVWLRPEDATREQLELIHAPGYVDWVANSVRRGARSLDPDTVVCPRSYDAALAACGGGIAGCDAILDGRIKQAFFAVRPPGHHAEHERSMGFCLFNNIAVSARHLVQNRGIARVAIYDFDAHHGNGTMHSFYDDPTVFYGSIHQWPLFPGTGRGNETGSGEGLGTTLNMPCRSGSGDDEYESATECFADAMEKFKPEFLLVSAGFDGHWSDPMAGLRCTEGGYVSVLRMLNAVARDHCQGRMALFLEGGYNLPALSGCTRAMVQTLLAEPW